MQEGTPFAKRSLTWWFTGFAASLCLVHFAGLDPKDMLLFSFSVPLWFLTVVGDVRGLPLFAAYFLTIAFWALIGIWADSLRRKKLETRRKTR